MHLTAKRDGTMMVENSVQDQLLEWLYTHKSGRLLLRMLVTQRVSEIGGWILDSGISRIAIGPFIRRNKIDMSEYEKQDYASYNEFFKRRLAEGARRIENEPGVFISPCDSRVGVYKIREDNTFSVKHTRYTAASLLRNRRLAEWYIGGYIWVFRLCVDDYHRYIYVDNGQESGRYQIPGVFHTVNPAANDHVPIYKENTREYSLLKTENFGTVVQMEVGALLVGKIENRGAGKTVRRGQEKGNFAFGGSTVILMTQPGRVRPDKDILKNSERGIETRVRLGEQVGVKEQENVRAAESC